MCTFWAVNPLACAARVKATRVKATRVKATRVKATARDIVAC